MPVPPDAELDRVVRRHRLEEPVYITRPTMPDLGAYRELLEPVWDRAWLTNDGDLHDRLRAALSQYLAIDHLSLCCNGTTALLLALQAAGIDGGEVVTTPFTFPATPHALHWNRVQPVFADIDPGRLTLDPARIEERIGPQTRGILPVHVFGTPCDVDAIEDIAKRHGLPVVYDAAHMMGARLRGRAVCGWGDFSVLSFHATKLFSTAEGGAVVSNTSEARTRVDFLKNFGIADEETVIGPGINGKLNELQAAFGLLQLEGLDAEIAARGVRARRYRERLRGVSGITLQAEPADVEPNHAYLPILVDADRYGPSRDDLWSALRRMNIITRKYFTPLCSRYPSYRDLPSADPATLPVAERVAGQVLCLPLYGTLPGDVVETICDAIGELQRVH